MTTETIAVVGLGYVGLPVAAALSRKWPTIGFDLNAQRVAELNEGFDKTNELSPEEMAQVSTTFTTDPKELAPATIFLVAVPTPINAHNTPDLSHLKAAMKTIAPT